MWFFDTIHCMNELDEVISKLQREIQEKRIALAQKEADLKMALRTRELARGGNAPPAPKARMSISDAIENILQVAGEQHVNQLLERLLEMKITPNLNKQTITSALTRYHNRGKRFRRVGKNKYALLNNGETKNENE